MKCIFNGKECETIHDCKECYLVTEIDGDYIPDCIIYGECDLDENPDVYVYYDNDGKKHLVIANDDAVCDDD